MTTVSPTDLTAGYISGPDATTEPRRQAFADVETARRVVLVEGVTDQIVIETLAMRRDIDLVGRGVVVAPMGGAHAIASFLDVIGRRVDRPEVVVGLCDEREADVFREAFDVARPDRFGIHVCRADLEAELVRALTPPRLEALIERQGDLAALRTLQKQAPWRDRAVHEQMHRFLRSKARRMHTYAVAMVEALDVDDVPAPLDGVARLL